VETGDARRYDVPPSRFRTALLRHPVRRRRRGTREGVGELHVCERKRSRPLPLRARHPDRGWFGPPRARHRSQDCTLYELFAARWNAGRSEGGERRDLPSDGSEGEPAATRGMDERRCGGTADLRRPVALRRGEGGVGRSRDPDDRRCTHDAYIWPARHAAGTSDRRCPPMGARFRLRASFAIGRFAPNVRWSSER
jgi:hypothetical protein